MDNNDKKTVGGIGYFYKNNEGEILECYDFSPCDNYSAKLKVIFSPFEGEVGRCEKASVFKEANLVKEYKSNPLLKKKTKATTKNNNIK